MTEDSNLEGTAELRTGEGGRRPLDPVARVLRVLFGLPALLLVIVHELLRGGDGELVYTPPSVEQDIELAPVVAVPVAIPVGGDERPVADLAPVLALPYYPEPKAKAKRKTRTPRKPKAKVMAAAARTTEPLFVKRGRRYVAVEGKRPQGETLYRRVSQGKRVRSQAA